ncbi:MAG: selenocysteine-specific translation elongation factor [Alphaproteobacteria bacterium]|nr:selenocysteine-specific translation elongation factor [Alphaproteobacteria bacterium]MBV9377752.1 selenocysteine-specific translation elongation factor [Alphaproteobacteria bacterium]
MILATAGHIDHGKTALIQALTGVDTDRLPEEKRRGLTIDLGFAHATLPDGTELGFVDVPGHERFLSNMLAGVLSIDRVLLVVAADDGPRPQTREHLDILELIGIGEVTGVVTKIDRVERARTAAVAAETEAMLAAAGFVRPAIFQVSSRTGDGIAALAGHLQTSAQSVARGRAGTSAPGLFRMPIDRAFTLAGIGLVLTGTIAAGTVATADRLVISPKGIPVRVRGLHGHNRPIETAAAGDRCAVNVVGSFPEGAEPRRGYWIVAAERHAPTTRLDLSLRVSRYGQTPLRDGVPVHLHVGTSDTVGRVAVLGDREIAPGAVGFVQVDLEHPIGALCGDRAVLRDHAARRTLAGGRVIDPFAPRRGRRQPARLSALEALAAADHRLALTGLLAVQGVVELGQFALARNLAPGELDRLTEADEFLLAEPARAPVAVSWGRLASLGDEIVTALGAWHQAQPDGLGPTRPALMTQLLGAAPEAALDAALEQLTKAGRAVRQGPIYHLPEHQPRLTRSDEQLWGRLCPLLAAGDLRPPRIRELAAKLGLEPKAVERLLGRAERLGRVARVADNRFFLPETLARLAETASALADSSPDGTFTAASFKDRSGVGRNLSIEVLEYLDKMGATRRTGDARIVLRGAEVFA